MVSILKTDQECKILDLCEKCLNPLGFRAVDVDCHVAGTSIVRIFIERRLPTAEPTGAATIQDCAQVSRLMSPLIDAENVIPGGYELEVSSPGLDRRLRLTEDFEKVVGEEVKLKLAEKLETLGANVTGKLLRAEGDSITVLAQGKEVPVPLNKIRRANRVWNFEKRN